MARTPHITAEMLLEAGAAITLEKGADALNVRSVAAKLNCSVQPVFSATSAAWKHSAAPSANI